MTIALSLMIVEFDGPTPATWSVNCRHCGVQFVFPITYMTYGEQTLFHGRLPGLLDLWRVPRMYTCPRCGVWQSTLDGSWQPKLEWEARQ